MAVGGRLETSPPPSAVALGQEEVLRTSVSSKRLLTAGEAVAIRPVSRSAHD
jgi:hypothetical protein